MIKCTTLGRNFSSFYISSVFLFVLNDSVLFLLPSFPCISSQHFLHLTLPNILIFIFFFILFLPFSFSFLLLPIFSRPFSCTRRQFPILLSYLFAHLIFNHQLLVRRLFPSSPTNAFDIFPP